MVEQFHADRGKSRKTPRYAIHVTRNAAKRVAAPQRRPTAKYTTASYGRAIARGVERANRKAGQGGAVPHWAPNQLRHTAGTEVRHKYGLEAAQAFLGHDRADVTQVYAERNESLAAKVASEVG